MVLKGEAATGAARQLRCRAPAALSADRRAGLPALCRSGRPVAARRQSRAPLDDASIELGAIYRSAAVLGEARPGGGDLLEDPRLPSGRPGTRIPHVELRRRGTSVSTHDLTGTGFALLAGSKRSGLDRGRGGSGGRGTARPSRRIGSRPMAISPTRMPVRAAGGNWPRGCASAATRRRDRLAGARRSRRTPRRARDRSAAADVSRRSPPSRTGPRLEPWPSGNVAHGAGAIRS